MKTETFRAIGDRVLVRPDRVEERQVGGVILPEVAQEAPLTGVVVSTGDKLEETAIAEGTKVLFSKYGGLPVEFDEGPHLLLREQEILGICG